MRRACRRDENHGEIVAAIRQLGWSVQDLSMVGGGCPDLLIGRRGVDRTVEIKRPKKKGQAAGRLSDGQKEWAAFWGGHPPVVIETVDDVVEKLS